MNKSELRGPFVVEIGDEMADEWEKKIEEAERDIREVRVNFRWTKPHLDVVKQAAARLGVPYQTYIKQAVMRAALADLGALKSVDLIEIPTESGKTSELVRHLGQSPKPTGPPEQPVHSKR